MWFKIRRNRLRAWADDLPRSKRVKRVLLWGLRTLEWEELFTEPEVSLNQIKNLMVK